MLRLGALKLALNSVLDVRAWSVTVGVERIEAGTYASYAMYSMDII